MIRRSVFLFGLLFASIETSTTAFASVENTADIPVEVNKAFMSYIINNTPVTPEDLAAFDRYFSKIPYFGLKQHDFNVERDIHKDMFLGLYPLHYCFTSENLTRLLPYLKHVKKLSLPDNTLGDSDIQKIGDLCGQNLTHLDLGASPVSYWQTPEGTTLTADATKVIAQMPNLTFLNLRAAGLTDKAVAPLSGMKNLKQLIIGSNPFGDQGLEAIAKNPSLTLLSIAKTKAPANAISILGPLKNLEILNISHLSNLKIENLSTYFPNLKVLVANGHVLNCNDLPEIFKCQNLEALSAQGPNMLAGMLQNPADPDNPDNKVPALPLISLALPRLKTLCFARNAHFTMSQIEQTLENGKNHLERVEVAGTESPRVGVEDEYLKPLRATLTMDLEDAIATLSQKLINWKQGQWCSLQHINRTVYESWMDFLKSTNDQDVKQKKNFVKWIEFDNIENPKLREKILTEYADIKAPNLKEEILTTYANIEAPNLKERLLTEYKNIKDPDLKKQMLAPLENRGRDIAWKIYDLWLEALRKNYPKTRIITKDNLGIIDL